MCFFKVFLYYNDYKFGFERSSNHIDFSTFQYNLEYYNQMYLIAQAIYQLLFLDRQ